MEYRFYLGIDTDSEDRVSATLIEKRLERDDADVQYHIDRIERLGQNGDIVEHVKDVLAEEPYVGHSICVVNASSREGRQLLRQMAAEGLSPMAITVNGGEGASADGPGIQAATDDAENAGFSVSEQTIIENLIEHESDGTLVFAEQQAGLASDLASGLQDFRSRSGEDGSGSSTEASSDGGIRNHDLVVSAALACWVGDQQAIDPTEHLGGELPTTGGAKRMQRPDTTS